MAKVILSSNVSATINELHRRIGSCEWSGVLFYTDNTPNLDLEHKVLYVEKIALMDIGTAASTSFEYDSDAFKSFIDKNDVFGLRHGLIHSHHNMQAYFSGTDKIELLNNARNHEFYLSLVVSFDCDFSVVIAQDINNCLSRVIPELVFDGMQVDDEIFNSLLEKNSGWSLYNHNSVTGDISALRDAQHIDIESSSSYGKRLEELKDVGNFTIGDELGKSLFTIEKKYNATEVYSKVLAHVLSKGMTDRLALAVYSHYLRSVFSNRAAITKDTVMDSITDLGYELNEYNFNLDDVVFTGFKSIRHLLVKYNEILKEVINE